MDLSPWPGRLPVPWASQQGWHLTYQFMSVTRAIIQNFCNTLELNIDMYFFYFLTIFYRVNTLLCVGPCLHLLLLQQRSSLLPVHNLHRQCCKGERKKNYKRHFLSWWLTRDHIGRSSRNSNPVMTSSTGDAKGCSYYRFRAPPAYTAQLLTLHQHRANNQYQV